MDTDDWDKPFPITSVSRSDIVSIGFSEQDVSSLSDIEMEQIATDMADDYLNQLFWDHLRTFTSTLLGKKK